MARSGKKFCLLLDTEKVLSTDELLELPESEEQSALSAGNSQPDLELPASDPLGLTAPEAPEAPEAAGTE